MARWQFNRHQRADLLPPCPYRRISDWRKEYGGLPEGHRDGVRTDQAHRLKALEQENSRLKRLVADLSLDSPQGGLTGPAR